LTDKLTTDLVDVQALLTNGCSAPRSAASGWCAGISDAKLASVEQGRRDALGDGSLSLAELRLDLAAVALKRQQWTRAEQLMALTEVLMAERRSAALQPLYWQLMSDLATMSSTPDPLVASTASANAHALLKVQQRRLFDPVRAEWIGDPVIDAEQKSGANSPNR